MTEALPETVVAFVRLQEAMVSSGTIHSTPGEIDPSFDELRIVKYGPKEYNLLYYNGGQEVADTGHGSIEEALEQAHFEFGVHKQDWRFRT